VKRRLNVDHLMTLIIFAVSLAVVVSDFLVITISTILGHSAGWTWFGFVSFMVAGILLDFSIDELKEILDNKKEK